MRFSKWMALALLVVMGMGMGCSAQEQSSGRARVLKVAQPSDQVFIKRYFLEEEGYLKTAREYNEKECAGFAAAAAAALNGDEPDFKKAAENFETIYRACADHSVACATAYSQHMAGGASCFFVAACNYYDFQSPASPPSKEDRATMVLMKKKCKK